MGWSHFHTYFLRPVVGIVQTLQLENMLWILGWYWKMDTERLHNYKIKTQTSNDIWVRNIILMYLKNHFCSIAVWSMFNCGSEKCIHHVIGVFFYIGLNNDFWCLTILINFTWNTFNLQEKKLSPNIRIEKGMQKKNSNLKCCIILNWKP